MLADVVVSTGGARQGFSRSLVEAQAMGRPVVAEDGGGAAETLRPDGVTGWVSPAGDAIALAESLQAALSRSGERRAGHARAAHEKARSPNSQAPTHPQMLGRVHRLAGR